MNRLYKMIAIFLIQPSMPAGQRTSRSFWLGVGTAFSAYALLQDWYGQRDWIALLEEHWVHMHWAWWIIPLVLCLVTQMFNRVAAEVKEKDDADV